MDADGSQRLTEIVDLVIKAIEKQPDPPRERIRHELLEVRELIMENRPPRILILGRRGAGKSSLINAIFAERVATVRGFVPRQEWP